MEVPLTVASTLDHVSFSFANTTFPPNSTSTPTFPSNSIPTFPSNSSSPSLPLFPFLQENQLAQQQKQEEEDEQFPQLKLDFSQPYFDSQFAPNNQPPNNPNPQSQTTSNLTSPSPLSGMGGSEREWQSWMSQAKQVGNGNYEIKVGGRTLNATSNVGHYAFPSQVGRDVRLVFKQVKQKFPKNSETHRNCAEVEALFEKAFKRVEESFNEHTRESNEKCSVCKGEGNVIKCGGNCERHFHLGCLPPPPSSLNLQLGITPHCLECQNQVKVLHWDGSEADFYHFAPFHSEEEALHVVVKGQKKELYYDPVWCCWRSLTEREKKRSYFVPPSPSPLISRLLEPPKTLADLALQTKLYDQQLFINNSFLTKLNSLFQTKTKLQQQQND